MGQDLTHLTDQSQMSELCHLQITCIKVNTIRKKNITLSIKNQILDLLPLR
ncbi:hypothetical protein KFK09_007559 [Dendrobium nobile]|uniref:Uncharacterized protein n=1 Tax=Dendrobium nobile TaxID=94219 RepID=A0A8T3BXF1_DENNO|nr:hypothetical protein KFK09_007559 [Dendrobium nobile]